MEPTVSLATTDAESVQESKRTRGTGSVYRRGDNYWIKYYRNGKSYRESAKTDDPIRAEKFLRFRLKQIAQATFVAPKVERITVDQLAEDFLRDYRINQRRTLDNTEASWRLHLKPVFGALRAADVSSNLLQQYVDKRLEEHATAGTINRELAGLKRMFNLGAAQTPPKVQRVPHFPHLRMNNARLGFVEESQYTKLAQACAAEGLWMRAMFEVAYTFGWRKAELLNMRVSQVDLAGRTLRLEVGTTKNGDGRTVVMTSLVNALMAQCVTGKNSEDYVFTRKNGQRIVEFRRTWEKVCTAAGMPDLLFHDLRRSGVRNMIRRGIPEVVAMKISGHKTRSVFDRYNIVSEADLADATRRMEQGAPVDFGHNYGHNAVPQAVQARSNMSN